MSKPFVQIVLHGERDEWIWVSRCEFSQLDYIGAINAAADASTWFIANLAESGESVARWLNGEDVLDRSAVYASANERNTAQSPKAPPTDGNR